MAVKAGIQGILMKIQNGIAIKMQYKNCLLIIAVLLGAKSVLADNLIKNSEFSSVREDFPVYWNNYGKRNNDTWVKLKKVGKDETYNLEVKDSGVRGCSAGIYQRIDKINSGHEYLLQIQFKNLSSRDLNGAFLQLRFLPSKKSVSSRLDFSSPESTVLSVRGVAPSGTTSAIIYVASTTIHSVHFRVKEVKMFDLGENKKIDYSKFSVPFPKKIPGEWLNKEIHPLLVCSRKDYFRARQAVKSQQWIKEYLKKQQKKCDFFISLSDLELKALVPPPGSVIVYGLGNNQDPVKGQRLRWAGWNNPFKVKDQEGNIYPNAEWQDDKFIPGRVRYSGKNFFTSRAYGFVHYELEQVVLPALADCYALTGDKKYAHACAVLLDAVAAAYPQNRRGPIDYPNPEENLDRCGRLDRANYMVARGLYNYATAIDLIVPSGELDQKSLAVKGVSIRENIIKNLLWDGGEFCLGWALETRLLTNGRADYFRGSGIVGTLLGQRAFFDPMAKALLDMVNMNVNRNGFYYETSTTYENHTIDLYTTMAELVEAGILAHGWKHCKSFFADQKLAAMISEFFNRREIGGHMPPIGDDGPDVQWNPPLYRNLSISGTFSNRFLLNQIKNAWLMLVRGNSQDIKNRAALLLKNSFPEERHITPEADRWAVFHIGDDQIDIVNNKKPDKSFFDTKSTFYGAKGVALLRGGEGDKRYGVQLFFGPVSVHGQWDIMSWQFVSDGVPWSFVPGYCNTHFRFGWNSQSVSHQMLTVNQKSVKKECGNGFLQAYLDSSDVQWLLASHPDVYSDYGVKKYRRMIAQVRNPATGKLAYWLDTGMVDGGKIRDDSFHSVMTKAEHKLPLEKLKEYSLYGDKYKGMTFGSDYRLSGFNDMSFYWIPPGDGYGFLVNPASCKTAGTQRMKFIDPGFKLNKNVPESRIIVDFATKSQSEIFLTDSLGTRHWIPSVPYVIRRQKGNSPSVFSKIIRVTLKNEDDPIDNFQILKVSSQDLLANCCVVIWKNGRRDIWIVSDGSKVEAKIQDGTILTSDAKVAMVTLDKSGAVSSAKMSGGTYLKLDEFQLTGQGFAVAKVNNIDISEQKVLISVSWEKKPNGILKDYQLMTSIPPVGLKSTWNIRKVTGDKILLNEFSVAIGTTVFFPVSAMPGWFNLKTPISSFYVDGKVVNQPFIKGKRIAVNGRVIASIADYKNGMYHLVHNNQDLKVSEAFTGTILELARGDKIVIPINSSLKIKSKIKKIDKD